MFTNSANESPAIAPLACPICKGPVGFAETYSKRIFSSFLVCLANSSSFDKASSTNDCKKLMII